MPDDQRRPILDDLGSRLSLVDRVLGSAVATEVNEPPGFDFVGEFIGTKSVATETTDVADDQPWGSFL